MVLLSCESRRDACLQEIPVDNTAYGSRAIDGESQQADHTVEEPWMSNVPVFALSCLPPLQSLNLSQA